MHEETKNANRIYSLKSYYKSAYTTFPVSKKNFKYTNGDFPSTTWFS